MRYERPGFVCVFWYSPVRLFHSVFGALARKNLCAGTNMYYQYVKIRCKGKTKILNLVHERESGIDSDEKFIQAQTVTWLKRRLL